MSEPKLRDLHCVSRNVIPTPAEVDQELPLSPAAARCVAAGRETVQAILSGRDSRLFAIVGPCSVHDSAAALDYAHRLQELSPQVADVLFLIMRVYFEKPRTAVGWKGFINDPDLDDSFHLEKGLREARRLLLKINELGVPAATEALDPISPQYMDDLITWTAIGARTVESQTHRELASGLSTPVGVKNSTDGSLGAALNALRSIAHRHHFLGINRAGQCCVFQSSGNPWAHLVLRGGPAPNYRHADIVKCDQALAEAGLRQAIMVDCSHGNSGKDPRRQLDVLADVIEQSLLAGSPIKAIMLESHIFGGKQAPAPLSQLKYGVSITDACLDWESTATALQEAAERRRR